MSNFNEKLSQFGLIMDIDKRVGSERAFIEISI